MSANWRRLAAIPDCVMKQEILRALDIVPPPQGASRSFDDAGLFIRRLDDGFSFLDTRVSPLSSRLLATPSDVLKASNYSVGTTTGEALRNWLCHWGHSRPGKPAPVPFAAATGFGPEHHGDTGEAGDASVDTQ